MDTLSKDIEEVRQKNERLAIDRELNSGFVEDERREVLNARRLVLAAALDPVAPGPSAFDEFIERATHMKPWKRCSLPRKRIKLLKFADNNQAMAKVLMEALDNKKIRNQDIECDPETGYIASIERLIDNGNGSYSWGIIKKKGN